MSGNLTLEQAGAVQTGIYNTNSTSLEDNITAALTANGAAGDVAVTTYSKSIVIDGATIAADQMKIFKFSANGPHAVVFNN